MHTHTHIYIYTYTRTHNAYITEYFAFIAHLGQSLAGPVDSAS